MCVGDTAGGGRRGGMGWDGVCANERLHATEARFTFENIFA